jgi:hypothetical protein
VPGKCSAWIGPVKGDIKMFSADHRDWLRKTSSPAQNGGGSEEVSVRSSGDCAASALSILRLDAVWTALTKRDALFAAICLK